MEVIPAIDLLEGRCVRLYQGDYARSQVFNENPTEVARIWIDQGASRLHVVDLDGAKLGKPVNTQAIEAIVQAVSVPVQVGGGLRDKASVSQLLDLGVEQVILGTVAVEEPELVRDLCTQFPGKILVGIDARRGWVATHGWLETSEVTAIEFAQQVLQMGAVGIIYTDIHRDGTLTGPNLETLRELVNSVSIPVIASGGVSSITDLLSLLALEPLGVSSAIVGRALYDGQLSLPEAIQAVGSGRWQDVPPNNGFSTFA